MKYMMRGQRNTVLYFFHLPCCPERERFVRNLARLAITVWNTVCPKKWRADTSLLSTLSHPSSPVDPSVPGASALAPPAPIVESPVCH